MFITVNCVIMSVNFLELHLSLAHSNTIDTMISKLTTFISSVRRVEYKYFDLEISIAWLNFLFAQYLMSFMIFYKNFILLGDPFLKEQWI